MTLQTKNSPGLFLFLKCLNFYRQQQTRWICGPHTQKLSCILSIEALLHYLGWILSNSRGVSLWKLASPNRLTWLYEVYWANVLIWDLVAVLFNWRCKGRLQIRLQVFLWLFNWGLLVLFQIWNRDVLVDCCFRFACEFEELSK